MNDNIDKVVKTVDAAGNIWQGIGRLAIAVTFIAGLIGAWFVYNKITDIGGMAVDAGKAVVEKVDVDAAKEKIQNAGEKTAEIRDSVGDAVGTATEGVGQKADEAIDKGLSWIEKRSEQWKNATDGDPDTKVNDVE